MKTSAISCEASFIGKFKNSRYDELLIKYDKDKNIKTIVIVTHTVPPNKFSESPTVVNSLFQKLFQVTHKLKYWFFGHTHQQHDLIDTENDIRFISHPRGRPEDFDREEYNVKKIMISKL